MSAIVTTNHGPLIVSSTYWGSAHEQVGKVWVSVNAGAIRVLVPRVHREIISEARKAKHAVLSRGPWPEMRLTDAVEILWEDGSDGPYAMHLSPESFDALPGEPPADQAWIISVWDYKKGRPHKAVERKCYWRRVPRIPYLLEWG